MNELELEIATELAAMGTELEGSAFWAEVSRLLTFGEDWWDQVQPPHRATRPSAWSAPIEQMFECLKIGFV